MLAGCWFAFDITLDYQTDGIWYAIEVFLRWAWNDFEMDWNKFEMKIQRFGMVLTWCLYDFDMNVTRWCDDSGMNLASFKHDLDEWFRFGMILEWFWHTFSLSLTWCRIILKCLLLMILTWVRNELGILEWFCHGHRHKVRELGRHRPMKMILAWIWNNWVNDLDWNGFDIPLEWLWHDVGLS